EEHSARHAARRGRNAASVRFKSKSHLCGSGEGLCPRPPRVLRSGPVGFLIARRRNLSRFHVSSRQPSALAGPLISAFAEAFRKTQALPAVLARIAFLDDALVRLAHALDAVLRLAALVRKRVDDLELATGRRAQRVAEEADGLPGAKLMAHVD